MFEDATLTGNEASPVPNCDLRLALNRNIQSESQPDETRHIVDWATVPLPDAWPDQLRWRLKDIRRLLVSIFGSPKRVELPTDLPGKQWLPKYLAHEFHGLPNGNFSKRITRGYITGFDRIMLGRMSRARQYIAHALRGSASVLDVGCGGGQTAAQLKNSGVAEVVAIDPSPYLLQHAARANPHVRFDQGIAESLRFRAERFDGVVACFVLHEIPPRVCAQALQEFHRVLKPGGRLVLCEPSAEQLRISVGQLFRRFGFAGLYFRWLAKRVHEPYVNAWHKQDVVGLLRAIGFDVRCDEQRLPVRYIQALKT